MIAILEAHHAGLLARRHWLPNLAAGLTVGIIALPLAMAFAIASGAKPEQGIYTAIIAGLAVTLFGGSRVQIAGPTGAFIAVLSGITASHGLAGLQVATLLAGMILLLLGLARMGSIIKFIPEPVIAGFTAGIGIIIWVGQWPHFLGLSAPAGTHFHDKFWHLITSMPQLHLPTLIIGSGALAIMIINPFIPLLRRIPAPLMAMVAAAMLQYWYPTDGVATIGSLFGDIPRGLPALQWPELTAGRIIELIGPAFAIAMLGAIESLLSAVVADSMAGTRHDANQELIGQGIANMLVPLFGGFAATGAIARTATSIRQGATSPLSGIMHVITLIIVIMVAAPLAVHIPLCALAAILFVVAWNLADLPHFISIIRRAPAADVIILLVTFTLTVLVDLVVAVNIGVILAMLNFLRRMAGSVEVAAMNDTELQNELNHAGMTRLPDGVMVLSIDGPIFFAAAETFKRALSITDANPTVLIIRLERVPFIDMTGIDTLESVMRDLQKRQVRIILTGANQRLKDKLGKAGIFERIGTENVCDDFSAALMKVR